MSYIVVGLAALFASALTFFSGFGLGTILLPVFALFFPIEVAIGVTAVVHFLNGLFKLFLVGKSADKKIVLLFGIPAAVAAIVGAQVLVTIIHFPPLLVYTIQDLRFEVTPVKLVIAVILLSFTALELSPGFRQVAFGRKYLPLGGVLSGFFGGLSGNQGLLRTAFLIKSGLSKEAFIATGVVIACLIDVARLGPYSQVIFNIGRTETDLLWTAVVSAFIGALLGNRLLKNVTMDAVRWVVSLMIILFSVLLGAGVI